MTERLLPLLLLGLLSMTVQAHNVIGGVYAIGDQIEGEVGFSNGDMAKPGTVVRVTDSQGRVLGEALTDAEGMFLFTATERTEHHFSADLGSGHVVKMSLPADELPRSLMGGEMQTNSSSTSSTQAGLSSAGSMESDQLQRLIEQSVARQVAPLRKELAAYKEKASLQDILGGIGYIFGLCGLGIWWRHRQTANGGASPGNRDDASGA